jgi:hypothetical protein
MSWRVSFYKADKNEPLIIKPEDENGYINVDVNGEQIINNEGTAIWQWHITPEEKENPELFRNLHPNYDCDYYEITKKGLEVIIRRYEEEIIAGYKELYETPSKEECGEISQDEMHLQKLKMHLRHKVWEWGMHLTIETDLDKDIYRVNNSNYWEYTVFNLIHLYKTFDFNKYALVLWGG